MTPTTQRRSVRLLGLLVAGSVLFAACGGTADDTQSQGDPQNAVNLNAETGEASCFQEMTDEQKAELVEFTDQQPVSEEENADGTQDICVLEKQSDGSYTEQHYAQEDNFSDYLLYSMLWGSSFGGTNGLLTYGYISGDLDTGQFLALSLLTGLGSDGRVYQPYRYVEYGSGNYGYARDSRPVEDARVSTVRYGDSDPVDYTAPSRRTVPTGYSSQPTRVPRAEDKVAEATRSSRPGSVATVSTKSGITASAVIAASRPASQPRTRAAAPPPKPIPNPSSVTTRSGSSSGGGSNTTVRRSGSSSGSSSGDSSSGGGSRRTGGGGSRSSGGRRR